MSIYYSRFTSNTYVVTTQCIVATIHKYVCEVVSMWTCLLVPVCLHISQYVGPYQRFNLDWIFFWNKHGPRFRLGLSESVARYIASMA